MRAARTRGRRSGAVRVATLLVALALASGCTSVYWAVKKSLRSPGEKLEDFPEKVWNEYDCDGRKLPFVRIEKNEVTPPRLRAGAEFNHRLAYVLCPEVPTKVVRGRLETRILFRGRAIVREADARFEIKPGRWTVDTFIQVPEQAEVGIYALQVEFHSPKLHFERRASFAVDRPARARDASRQTRLASP